MGVFDDGPHTEGYLLYGEPASVYLNRSTRPEVAQARETIEAWFSRFPPSDQEELRARLRSADDSQHHAAFFELLLHELLRRLGCDVDVHPNAPSGSSKRPDFLARPKAAAPFYVEAVLATGEPRERMAARARLRDFYRVLDTISSPNFFLHVEATGSATTPIPGKRFRAEILAAIGNLDPDQVARQLESRGLGDLPTIELAHEALALRVIPIPKNLSRGKPGVRTIGSKFSLQYLDAHVAIRDAVVAKANRYGDMDLPYVIAVNGMLDHVDQIDIANAFFGTEVGVARMLPNGEPGSIEMTRRLDGAWVNSKGPRYTRVSAVLLGIGIDALRFEQADVRLYHNPYAAKPYDSVLTRLHTARLPPEFRAAPAGSLPDDCFVFDQGLPIATVLSEP